MAIASTIIRVDVNILASRVKKKVRLIMNDGTAPTSPSIGTIHGRDAEGVTGFAGCRRFQSRSSGARMKTTCILIVGIFRSYGTASLPDIPRADGFGGKDRAFDRHQAGSCMMEERSGGDAGEPVKNRTGHLSFQQRVMTELGGWPHSPVLDGVEFPSNRVDIRRATFSKRAPMTQ